MESHPESSRFSSLPQLLEALATLIASVTHERQSPWLSITTVDRLFQAKHGVSLDAIAQTLRCSCDVRTLLQKSQRFAIYGTPNPHDFYIALLDATVPGGVAESVTTIQYRVKRPWKVDGRLTRMLQSEGAQELPSQWSQPAR